MKKDHAAIIARARRDGLKPVELAHELMGYTLIEAMRDASASQSVAFSKMSEVQQDSCIQQWTAATKEAIDLAIQVIASAGTRTVRMDLTSVAVGKKLKVAGVVAGTEEYKHDLIDLANDQGTAIVILNERDYLQGLDGIHGEKDQKALALDDSAPADKAAKKPRNSAKTGGETSAGELAKKPAEPPQRLIELPPKLMEDARAFLANQQNCKRDALQNHLKIGALKADAVLAQLEVEGLVQFVGDEKSGSYEMIRKLSPTNDSDYVAPSFDGDDDPVNDPEDAQPIGRRLTDELYDQIKAKVISSGKVSIGALSVAFSLDDDIVEQAVDRLEMNGVVSEENEMGTRTVILPEEA